MTVIAKKGTLPSIPLCRTTRTEWKEAWRTARVIVKSEPQNWDALASFKGALWVALLRIRYSRNSPDPYSIPLAARVVTYRIVRGLTGKQSVRRSDSSASKRPTPTNIFRGHPMSEFRKYALPVAFTMITLMLLVNTFSLTRAHVQIRELRSEITDTKSEIADIASGSLTTFRHVGEHIGSVTKAGNVQAERLSSMSERLDSMTETVDLINRKWGH